MRIAQRSHGHMDTDKQIIDNRCQNTGTWAWSAQRQCGCSSQRSSKCRNLFDLITNHWQNPEFEVRCHYFSNLSNLVDIILSNVVWRKYANVGSCRGRAHCILHTCVYSPGITQNMDWGETFKWFTVTFVMEWEFLQQSAGQQTGNTGTVLVLQYPTDHEN